MVVVVVSCLTFNPAVCGKVVKILFFFVLCIRICDSTINFCSVSRLFPTDDVDAVVGLNSSELMLHLPHVPSYKASVSVAKPAKSAAEPLKAAIH